MSYSLELAEWLKQLTPAELAFWETKSQFAKARFFATIPSGKRLKALRAEINEQKRIDSMSVDERDQEHEQWLKQLTTAELSAWEAKSQSEKNWLFEKMPPDKRLKVLRAEINVREWLDSMSTDERERMRELETCSECGGDVRIIASIEDPAVIKQILAHMDNTASSAATALLPDCRASPRLPLGLLD